MRLRLHDGISGPSRPGNSLDRLAVSSLMPNKSLKASRLGSFPRAIVRCSGLKDGHIFACDVDID